jgi:hypothetical protein
VTAIGIIGEDKTDCDTVAILVRRILDAMQVEHVGLPMRYPARGGCGQLRRKAPAFLNALLKAGCSAAIFLHDLDLNPVTRNLNDAEKLRRQLEAIKAPYGLNRHICIPIEEIEAWFWSDQAVLDLIGRGQGKSSTSPHTIRQPKEALQRLSRRAHNKCVYSTNDNTKLAEKLDLDLCAKHCPAFGDLRGFVQRALA